MNARTRHRKKKRKKTKKQKKTQKKFVNSLELLFIFIPISTLLWLFGFSSAFAHRMVYPLTALFFGTGQQARLFFSYRFLFF